MNARIKKLAIQAGYTTDMFDVGHWDMPECQKFVELLIRECADALWSEECNISDLALQQYNHNINKILKHFEIT